MDKYISTLLKIEKEGFERIKESSQNSDIDFDILEDLINEGLIKAVDISSDDGRGYMDIRITKLGSEYIDKNTLSRNAIVDCILRIFVAFKQFSLKTYIVISGLLGLLAALKTLFFQ